MLVRKHRGGAGRLVSAVAVLALVLAQLIGAYAHAAGHDHATGHDACAHQHGHGTAVAPGSHDPRQDQTGHGNDRATHGECCDFMCHGSIAILVTSAFVYVDPAPPYALAVATFDHLLLPASLERPPKSPVRA